MTSSCIVDSLATAKRLDSAQIRSWGVKDADGGILIPYYAEGGELLFQRERDTENCRRRGKRFLHPYKVPLVIYGLWRIDRCRRAGHAWLCEGESDTWSLWSEELPALGLPSATSAKVLREVDFAGIEDLFLLPDNDPAGEQFVVGVAKEFAAKNWPGRLWRITVPAPCKDVSDWRCADPANFRIALNLALANRVRVAPNGPSKNTNGHTTNGEHPPAKAKKPIHRPDSYVPFPLGLLPVTLREYVEASAAAIGCEAALVALPGLAVVASCIGNSRAVQLRRKWSEPPIVWALTVMRSGGVKSAGFGAATDALFEVQADAWDDYREMKDRYEAAPRSQRNPADEPKPPPCLITSDPTIEAVGELLRHNPRGLLMARDEMDGWFQSFTRHQKGGGTDRPHWLELHQARPLRLDRITRQQGALVVRRACCSLCGTIQPSVLANALDAEALGAGLGARFLLAMPPVRRRVWTEAEVNSEIECRYNDLLKNLLALPLAEAVKRKPHFLRLSDDAKQFWINWFNAWGRYQFGALDARAAVLAKLEGYAARLALIHHVVTRVSFGTDDLQPIEGESIAAGCGLAEWFAAESDRVYSIFRETMAERQQRELIQWIEAQGGSTTAKNLRDSCRGMFPQTVDAEASLSALADEGLGSWQWQTTGSQGGRPSRLFQLAALETSDSPGFSEVSSAAGGEIDSGRGSNGSPREPGEDG